MTMGILKTISIFGILSFVSSSSVNIETLKAVVKSNEDAASFKNFLSLNRMQSLELPQLNASKATYTEWPYNPLQLWNTEVLEKSRFAANISEQCDNDVSLFIVGLTTGQPWALQMIDATGKPIPSVSKGLRWLGDYDSCQSTNVSGILRLDGFSTQTVNVWTLLPLGLPSLTSIAMCVPKSCSPDDIVELIRVANPERPPEFTLPGQAANSYREPYSPGAIVLIMILSILCGLTVVGTFLDMFVAIDKKGASLWLRLLLLFSMYSNTVKLFQVSDASDNNLLVIHGIRFFSATWVVLGHALLNLIYRNFWQIEFYQDMTQRWTMLGIVGGEYAVDTFFLLSGTMVAYTMMRQLTAVGGPKKFGWGWLQYYVHRYWRLTPSLMLTLAIYTSLFQYFGDGPMWGVVGAEPFCAKNWWTNLLYINNLVNEEEMCFPHTWYLALDMQFYIISPLFLIALFCNWAVGVGAILAVILACSIASGVLSTQYGAPLGMIGSQLQPLLLPEFFTDVYIKPWFRIGPYLVGLLLGYALFRTKLKMKLHWVTVACGWSFATIVALTIVYGPYPMMEGNFPSVEVASFYNSVSRTAWGVCVAWVVFACTHGYGGYVNELLSWKAFVPLSRLTYMLYLIHMAVMQSYFDSRRQLNTMDNFQVILLYLGLLVVSYMLAYVCSMVLEIPLAGLEKVLLSSGSKHKKEDQTLHEKKDKNLVVNENIILTKEASMHKKPVVFDNLAVIMDNPLEEKQDINIRL